MKKIYLLLLILMSLFFWQNWPDIAFVDGSGLAEARPGGGHSSGGGDDDGGGGGGGGSGGSYSDGGDGGGSYSGGGGGSSDGFVIIIVLGIFHTLLVLSLLNNGLKLMKGEFTVPAGKPVPGKITGIVPIAVGVIGIWLVFKGVTSPEKYIGVLIGLWILWFLTSLIVFVYLGNRKTGEPIKVSYGPTSENLAQQALSLQGAVENLKQSDPNFSKVLFLEFADSLYYKYHTFLGTPQFKDLGPFLAENVRANAQREHRRRQNLNLRVTEAVISNLWITSIRELPTETQMIVELQANYTTSHDHQGQITHNRHEVEERWLFVRNRTVISPEPDKLRHISCPSCGAPSQFTDAGSCEFCGTQIKAGEMQWAVTNIAVMRQKSLVITTQVTYAQETGTNLPTIKHPQLSAQIGKFSQQHQITDWKVFMSNFRERIVNAYFMAIYEAWSRNTWSKVRHLIADRLYESSLFWIENYKRQGLFNKLDKIEIKNVELASIELDKYYDAFTVRISAACLDYTVNRENKVVGGSDKHLRHFSEYWTFIRRAGLEKPADEGADLTHCPNCGAATDKMGQAADCGYCSAKISTGDFSWVLTAIVQDEAYRG